jgi:hypothetical protein
MLQARCKLGLAEQEAARSYKGGYRNFYKRGSIPPSGGERGHSPLNLSTRSKTAEHDIRDGAPEDQEVLSEEDDEVQSQGWSEED